jgi:hypothetical protein
MTPYYCRDLKSTEFFLTRIASFLHHDHQGSLSTTNLLNVPCSAFPLELVEPLVSSQPINKCASLARQVAARPYFCLLYGSHYLRFTLFPIGILEAIGLSVLLHSFFV